MLAQKFEKQVNKTPKNIAVKAGGKTFNYLELNRYANRIAYLVKETANSEIVGLLFEHGLHMIAAILAVLKAGKIYVPLSVDYPLDRLSYMISDSASSLILTNTLNKSLAQQLARKNNIPLLDIEGAEPTASAITGKNPERTVLPDKNAYILYTSGSTGRPKGVVQTHKNADYYNRNWTRVFSISETDRMTLFSSFCHDGSVQDMFSALHTGAALYPFNMRNPGTDTELSVFLAREKITVWHSVPSLFCSFANTLNGDERFPDLRFILLGGEPVREHEVLMFKKYFLHSRLAVVYGQTESSVNSIYLIDHHSKYKRSLIGAPLDKTRIFVIDGDGEPVEPMETGEILVNCPHLSPGYWRNPQATRKVFGQHEDMGQLYWTGDMGRLLADGSIEFLGRRDSQVKIRGYRVELGEIENQLLQHRLIKEAAVTLHKDKTGDDFLCAYIVAVNPDDTQLEKEYGISIKLKKHLARFVPDYMLPSYIVPLKKMPRTPSGKIDRKALPLPAPGESVDDGATYTAPGNEIEKKLVEIWSEMLGIEAEKLSIEANFFESGGHSLKASIMTSKVHKELDVKLPLAEVFKTPTIRALAGYIKKTAKDKYKSLKPVEKKEYYELSSAQKRIYFLQQLDLNSTGYNMSFVLSLGKDLEKDKLEFTLKKLVARHETLRTSFIPVDEIPVQKVHHEVEFQIEYYDLYRTRVEGMVGDYEGTGGLAPLPKESAASTIKNFIRPFDLSKAPLLRSGLIKLTDGNYTWIVDMHHIISDGTSHMILTGDFISLYNREELEPLRLQYKEFSQWQNRLFESGEIDAQENYWLELYADAREIPRLNLPIDFKRPEVFTFEGDRYRFVLEREDAVNFKTLSSRSNGTLFMNFLAALDTLFYKYTGQEDIIIGTGIAGRSHEELQQIVGMFVNKLVIRSFPTGEKTYVSFLREVITQSVKAFENQDAQFEELVDKLELERDISRSPLFDIVMVVQNFRRAAITGGISLEKNPGQFEQLPLSADNLPQMKYDNPTAKFDMTFFVHEQGDDIFVNIEYYTGLFKKDTIRRLVSHFNNIVKAVVKEPSIKLKDIEFISRQEKQQILYEFNDTSKSYPKDKTLQELFAQQVEKTPDHVAVVMQNPGRKAHSAEERHAPCAMLYAITYRTLDKQSHQLAYYLSRDKHIRPDDRVGILMDRSIDFTTAVLGILKAGGAYVPMDPGLPEERLERMINDAGTAVVISQKRCIRVLNRLQWQCESFHTFLCVDSNNIYLEEELEKNQLMNENLWEYLGETAYDEITLGGWLSSYTGEPFSKQEMDEYADNILVKLKPFLHQKTRVLEIGCGSGFTMYRLAPKVEIYYGTDLSSFIIQENLKRVKQEDHKNIVLSCMAAHRIDELKEKDFDLIIMNSVIQNFHGHNYLRQVLGKCVNMLSKGGIIFIGDVMDHDLKKKLIKELKDFKQANPFYAPKTKIDWSAELFGARAFFEDLVVDIPKIRSVEFSDKIFTLENELTKFRYDVLITVDNNPGADPGTGNRRKKKHKYQEDLGKLEFASSRDGGPKEMALSRVNADNLAYVLYTSGSTGIPKGVMVEHRSVHNLVIGLQQGIYHIYDAPLNICLLSPFMFDASIKQIFAALLQGHCLHIVPGNIRADGAELLAFYRKYCIDVSDGTPSHLQLMLTGSPDNRLNHHVKHFIIGGEVLPVNLTGTFLNQGPTGKESPLISNVYGPTECCVDSTLYRIAREDSNFANVNAIPIGKPLPNQQVYILDDQLNLQPIGVTGEICIGGDNVSKGYLNNREATENTFIANPFSSGERLYRTGDLGRWLPDGNIEFIGRIDRQVKIRGFRIELQEIENQLLKHHKIKEAVVIDRSTGMHENCLCAYIVNKKQPLAVHPEDAPGIRFYGKALIASIKKVNEKNDIFFPFDFAANGYSKNKKVAQLFEQRTQQIPHQVVIRWEDVHLTYSQLSENANRVFLILKNSRTAPGPNTKVAILLENPVEMFISMLGITKAGKDFFLLDPRPHANEIVSRMKDMQTSILLTNNYTTKNKPFTLLQGLGRGKTQLVITPPRQSIHRLDCLPFPNRSLVNYEKYTQYIGQSLIKNSISMLGSRGCPYNCKYCHKIWPKKHISRSAENIFAEMLHYYNIGLRRFVFLDDIFNLDVGNTGRLFDMIIARGLDIQLCLNLRGDILSREYIDLMIKAGVIRIALALETAAPRLQKMIGKNLNLDRFKANMEYICKNYPQVILEINTMHGFPSETPEEAKMTLDFMKNLKWVHFPYLNILKIYPNTEMEKLALAHGISQKAINESSSLAYHELPDTLPFDKSFTMKYQLEFMSEYFLLKERLLHVLPYQMQILSQDEILQKYNSYLPVEIRSFDQLLEFTNISPEELDRQSLKRSCPFSIPGLNKKLKQVFPSILPAKHALKILLLDLTQLFGSDSENILYNVVEAPLGLMYLAAYLEKKYQEKVEVKILKSRIDFDHYADLKVLLEEFQPHLLGIRSLTYFKDFFHRTIAMIRHWGMDVPIVAGGPYASSDFKTILQDERVNLVVLGEGEETLSHLVAEMIAHQGKLPGALKLKEIPGIAFVSEKHKFQPGSINETILLDSLNSKDIPGNNSINHKKIDPLLSLLFSDNTDPEPVTSELREFLAKELPEYMIPPYFVVLENLPLIPNGKIDIKALPEPQPGTGRTEYIPPRNEIEKKLAVIWSQVLNITEESISMNSNFFELGGHSLKATILISYIHKELDIKLPLAEIFKTPTIEEIADVIELENLVENHGNDQVVNFQEQELEEFIV